MSLLGACVQVRLATWQCSRTVRAVERMGVARFVRMLTLFTWLSTLAASVLGVGLMVLAFRHVAAYDPALSVWAMLASLLLGTVACWTWSSAWGLGALRQLSIEEWRRMAHNPVQAHKGFAPSRVWQLHLINVLLDPAGLSALQQKSLSQTTPAPPAPDASDEAAHTPTRF